MATTSDGYGDPPDPPNSPTTTDVSFTQSHPSHSAKNDSILTEIDEDMGFYETDTEEVVHDPDTIIETTQDTDADTMMSDPISTTPTAPKFPTNFPVTHHHPAGITTNTTIANTKTAADDNGDDTITSIMMLPTP